MCFGDFRHNRIKTRWASWHFPATRWRRAVAQRLVPRWLAALLLFLFRSHRHAAHCPGCVDLHRQRCRPKGYLMRRLSPARCRVQIGRAGSAVGGRLAVAALTWPRWATSGRTPDPIGIIAAIPPSARRPPPSGGIIPYLATRFAIVDEMNVIPGAEERGPIAQTLRRLYWDTALSWHPPNLRMLRSVVGLSQVLFGSDYL
jgi:hypothetical protein